MHESSMGDLHESSLVSQKQVEALGEQATRDSADERDSHDPSRVQAMVRLLNGK